MKPRSYPPRTKVTAPESLYSTKPKAVRGMDKRVQREKKSSEKHADRNGCPTAGQKCKTEQRPETTSLSFRSTCLSSKKKKTEGMGTAEGSGGEDAATGKTYLLRTLKGGGEGTKQLCPCRDENSRKEGLCPA